MNRPSAGFGPHLSGPLVLAALLVAVVESRVAQPSRSDAAGALYSAGAAWTINGRGWRQSRLSRSRHDYRHL